VIRSNLSTRPFYNERAAHLALVLVAVAVVAVTAFNVQRLISLSAQNTELSTRIARDEAAAADLTRKADAVRQSTNRRELEAVAAAAREANDLIDQRTFSWTAFFNLIETTLPPDVMLTAVRPQIRAGVVTLTMGVVGRRTDDIDAFMAALEQTKAFEGLLPRQEEVTEEGLHRAVLIGRYVGHPEGAAAPDAVPGERSGS